MSIWNRIKNVFTGEMEWENDSLRDQINGVHDRYAEYYATLKIDLRLANSKIYGQQQELYNQLKRIRELTEKLEGNVKIYYV